MKYLAVKPDASKGFGPAASAPLEAARECPVHGMYKALQILPGVFSFCPQCAAERDREISQSAAAARDLPLAVPDFERMRIPPLHYQADFDSFKAGTDELKRNIGIVKRLCAARKGNILMLGNAGTGKTHLAVAALKHFRNGLLYTVYEINLMLKQTYKRGENKEKAVLDSLIETPLLAIDRIGDSGGSKWEINWFTHVFSKRHEYFMPTLIISNPALHHAGNCPEKKKGRANPCPYCVERFLGNTVISRIRADGVILYFSGGDYRLFNRRAV
jgi:DNA replication protein DnaC